jgi:hypothetical protein
MKFLLAMSICFAAIGADAQNGFDQKSFLSDLNGTCAGHAHSGFETLPKMTIYAKESCIKDIKSLMTGFKFSYEAYVLPAHAGYTYHADLVVQKYDPVQVDLNPRMYELSQVKCILKAVPAQNITRQHISSFTLGKLHEVQPEMSRTVVLLLNRSSVYDWPTYEICMESISKVLPAYSFGEVVAMGTPYYIDRRLPFAVIRLYK